MEGLPQGKALDIAQCGAGRRLQRQAQGTNDYADIAGADVVIVTAGVPRKPGMSRDDLLGINLKVMAAVGEGIKAYAPNAFVICITNPLDAMVWALRKFSGHAARQDRRHGRRARQRALPPLPCRGAGRRRWKMSRPSCWAAMATPWCRCRASPPWRASPLPELVKMGWIKQERFDQIVQRTRDGGAEIVGLLKTGSAYYAPASAASPWRKAISRTRSGCCPWPPMSNGAYGIKDLYVGVPAVIGDKGVERIVELELTADEKAALAKSADSVKGLIEACKKLEPRLG